MTLLSVRIGHLIATGFGAGQARHAPGSWGSLQAFGLWCLMEFLTGGTSIHLRIGLALSLSAVALWAAMRSLDHPSRGVAAHAKPHDPGDIVIDEWAGMWWALLPVALAEPLPLFSALLLFRLFDILKPWPVRDFEKLPGAWGVVADDIAAGLLAAIVISLALLIS